MVVLAEVSNEGASHVSADSSTSIDYEGMPQFVVRLKLLVIDAERMDPVRHPLPGLLHLRVPGRSLAFTRWVEEQQSRAGRNRFDESLLEQMGAKHYIPYETALLRTRLPTHADVPDAFLAPLHVLAPQLGHLGDAGTGICAQPKPRLRRDALQGIGGSRPRPA